MKHVVLILLMIGFVSAGCIDINSADLDKLDEIVWVGPATARKIIDARPFEDIDDLTKVVGIGESKLTDIKEEGLACVDIEEEIEKEKRKNVENVDIVYLEEKEPEVISLNEYIAKEIDKLVYVSNNAKIVDWLPYGFALFLIFIIGILLWERF